MYTRTQIAVFCEMKQVPPDIIVEIWSRLATTMTAKGTISGRQLREVLGSDDLAGQFSEESEMITAEDSVLHRATHLITDSYVV